MERRPALQTPAPLDHFRLQGRLSVRSGEKQFSGGITWKRVGEDQTLLLSTPLGQGVAELNRSAAGVELIDADKRRHVAADAETLLRDVTGMDLPLAGLSAWLTGAARGGVPFHAESDPDGHIALIDQDGWHIELSRHVLQLDRWLPGKIVARHGEDLEVKLVVDEWAAP